MRRSRRSYLALVTLLVGTSRGTGAKGLPRFSTTELSGRSVIYSSILICVLCRDFDSWCDPLRS